MIKIFILYLFLIPLHVLSQSNPPDTDIWLFQIIAAKGNIQFTQAKKIAGENGYENQPCYSNDGQEIYYAAMHNSDTTTSIYSYQLASEQTKKITFTNTSLFSPMPSYKGDGISVLKVEENNAQRIWQYPFKNMKSFPLFPKRDSIGYYAWIDAHTVLAFILPGKENPTRFSLIKDDGTEKKIAEDVARGMKIIGNGALYVKIKDSTNYLCWSDFITTKQLCRTPGNSVDIAIYKDYVLMADKGIIYAAKMKMSNMQLTGLEEFTELQDVSSFGLKNISRMAVSPDEKSIALVNAR